MRRIKNLLLDGKGNTKVSKNGKIILLHKTMTLSMLSADHWKDALERHRTDPRMPLWMHGVASHRYNFCGKETQGPGGCSVACLDHQGRGRWTSIQIARLARNLYFLEDRGGFYEQMDLELTKANRLTPEDKLTGIRLNTMTDLAHYHFLARYTGKTPADYPRLSFYDYTKHSAYFKYAEQYDNVHFTFSWSGNNKGECQEMLKRGHNVAVPFSPYLPPRFLGREVINGDASDYRPMDPTPVIVGLLEKGKNGTVSDFIVRLDSSIERHLPADVWGLG